MILRHAAPYREVTPFDEDMTDEFREVAYENHDTLVAMGGRPTRPVLEEPAGKAVYKKDEGIIDIIDEHGKLTCTLEYDMSPINYHWGEECVRFEEELDRWKEFQDYQRRNSHLSPLKTAFDLADTDEPLQAILRRLNEWQEFEAYHQGKVKNALTSTWRTRKNLVKLFRKEAASDRAASNSKIKSKIRYLLDWLCPRQVKLENSQRQLAIIENQAFEMLSEACVALEGAHLLCQQLEKKIEEQTNAVYQELLFLEARPSRTPQAPCPTAPFVQRILHWKSETSRFLKERREWKMFLKWRGKPTNASNLESPEQLQSNGRGVDLALWFDHVRYRKVQLKGAKKTVVCWRRLQSSTEKGIERARNEGLPTWEGPIASEKYVESSQQDVGTAEARLQSAQQKLAELSSQQATSAAREASQNSPQCQQLPPSPPDSDACRSRSSDREILDLGISPTEAHQPSPTQKRSGSVHASSVPCQVGDKQAGNENTEEAQLSAKSDADVPGQRIFDDDIQMTDAPHDTNPHETIGKVEEAEPIDTIMSDIEDILMIDVEDPVNPSSTPALEVDPKSRGTRATRKPSLPIHQVPTSRKTRSATKNDQAISSGVLKKNGKKPANKAKAFTEQQTQALLDAASTICPSTGPAPLRRSERLKEKAAASIVIPLPQINDIKPSQSSRQKKPKKQPSPTKPSQSSKQKKPKAQSDALESNQSSGTKTSKAQPNAAGAIESSRSSRQNVSKRRVRDRVR